MPAPATAVRADVDTGPGSGTTQAAQSPRTALYGGLVGGMIEEIEHRVTGLHMEASVGSDVHDDVFHSVSVAAGYVGLAAGIAVTVFGIAVVF